MGGAHGIGEVYEVSPTHLVFTSQPSHTTAGAVITPAITVAIENSQNQIVTTDNSSVTLALVGAAATLGGASVVQAKNGVATFTNLAINKAATYFLKATDTADIAATSHTFIVSAAAASKLVFSTQPVGTTPGKSLGSVKVSVEDKFGNVVSNNSTTITLSIASGSSGSSLSGVLMAKPTDGIATFGNLSLNKAGTYSLHAADGGAAGGYVEQVCDLVNFANLKEFRVKSRCFKCRLTNRFWRHGGLR